MVASAMGGNLLRTAPIAYAAGPAVIGAPAVAYSAYGPAAVVSTRTFHGSAPLVPAVRTVAYGAPVYAAHAAPVLVH
jgi:hypothetical protein